MPIVRKLDKIVYVYILTSLIEMFRVEIGKIRPTWIIAFHMPVIRKEDQVVDVNIAIRHSLFAGAVTRDTHVDRGWRRLHGKLCIAGIEDLSVGDGEIKGFSRISTNHIEFDRAMTPSPEG